MNNNIIEKFQGGGKSTKTLRNFLNRASKTAESALTNLQDYGREKNLPRWITDAFDPNRDIAPYAGKYNSGILPEINISRFNYDPKYVPMSYDYYKNIKTPVSYFVDNPTPVLRKYTEYNPTLKSEVIKMGLNDTSKDVKLYPFILKASTDDSSIIHRVEVPKYENPIKNYLHPTNGAANISITYHPRYVYKPSSVGPVLANIKPVRVNEYERRGYIKELVDNGWERDMSTYPNKLIFNRGFVPKNRYLRKGVPEETIELIKDTHTTSGDTRYVGEYTRPYGDPFRNNQFLTKTAPIAVGAGALGAFVSKLLEENKNKSKEK